MTLAPPPPPAHVAAYVEILGVDLAVELFVKLGGSEVYFAENPKGNGMVEKIVGKENTAALAGLSDSPSRRVPSPNRWLAQVLASRGLPVAEISRRLRKTDVTVRSYLRGQTRDDPRQIQLF